MLLSIGYEEAILAGCSAQEGETRGEQATPRYDTYAALSQQEQGQHYRQEAMHAMEDYHAGTGTVEAIRLKRQGRMGESLHLEVKQHLLMGGRSVAQPPTETLETLGPAEGSLSLHIALKVDRSSCRARDLQDSAFVKGFTRFLSEVSTARVFTPLRHGTRLLTTMLLPAERHGPRARVDGPARDRRNDRCPQQ